MSHFDKAIGPVLQHEGGYVNHPADPGGETNYGITKRNYPALDIRNLTREQAIAIYRNDYWRDYMDQLPELVAVKHFDQAVNMGHHQAVKLLQRAIGCDDDGEIGPITLAAVKAYPPEEIVNNLVTVQRAFYTSLATRKPAMQVFLKGWLARANWTPGVDHVA